MQKYDINKISNFINDIKKYLTSPNYIKINNKPVLGIYDPSAIPEVKNFLFELRKESRLQEIGEIYILSPAGKIPITELNLIDAAFDMKPIEYY